MTNKELVIKAPEQTMLNGSELRLINSLAEKSAPMEKPKMATAADIEHFFGKPAPATSPTKAPAAPKAKKPSHAPKAPAKVNEKPAPLAKSGKVETSLTTSEKAKRQKSLETITADIRKETGNITSAYMRIGFRLWQVREQKLFLAVEVDGKALKNVYEYSEMAFGFKKSSAINFIAVCERFSIHDAKGNPTDKIDPAFAAFGYTQLSVMLPLSDDKIKEVNPDMSKRDIAAVGKGPSSDESTEDSDPNDESPAPTRKVVYDGAVTPDTYDKILGKLDKLIGKKIQIVVLGD